MDKIFKKSDTNIHVSTDQTVIFYKEIETKFIKFKPIPMEKKKVIPIRFILNWNLFLQMINNTTVSSE